MNSLMWKKVYGVWLFPLYLIVCIQAKGGGLAFLKGDLSELAAVDGKLPQTLLAYINGDREFVLFNPYVIEAHELSMTRQDDLVALEETGGLLCFIIDIVCSSGSMYSTYTEVIGSIPCK